MKAKLLLCFLLSQTLMAYACLGADRPGRLQSYFEKIKSIVSKPALKEPVNMDAGLFASGQFCRGTNFVTTAVVMWSDPSTWSSLGTSKPVAGSSVTIPAGVHLILDESSPSLASLTINGKLEFARQDLSLTAGWIMVMGTLEVGTVTTPFVQKATITLNAADMNGDAMGMGTRGIMVMGGKLELHGVAPTKAVTKLNEHAARDSKSLTLLDAVSWQVNDEIVVATTDYYSDFYLSKYGSTQRTQITAINGNAVAIQDGLNSYRWGKMQYLTKDGMSLTPGTLPAGILPGTPTELDERAEVANLTRNIVVQSVDDDLWKNNGFGCHIMIMRMDGVVGEARLNGVEIRRGGQAGKLGRYPFHWHMLSYEGSTTLKDVTGQYIRNSTINQSSQRGIVIHGTNGTEVKNNVVYDVRGHGVFTEDAVERRNIIDGNLVLKVRNPLPGQALKKHEAADPVIGSSGFWISNPDNTITNNTAVDCSGTGFWLAFPTKTFGASKDIPLVPIYMKFGTFNKNTAHSNQHEGIFIDSAESDEEGTTELVQYFPTKDMQPARFERGGEFDNVLTFELTDYSVWKNSLSGVWNSSAGSRNRRAVSADNTQRFFAGRTNTVYPGAIEKTLVVGTSLNYNMNGVILPPESDPISGFASYHSSFDIMNNVIVNFPAVKGYNSGAFALSDYYITAVDKGTFRNPGNILINSHPGVKTRAYAPHFVLAVLWDRHNYWGGPASQDNYYVYDTPYFTDGQTPHIVPNSTTEVSGGVIVNGPFYGFSTFRINGIDRVHNKIVATRMNKAGAVVGNLVVEETPPGGLFGNMRSFATHPTGYYSLDFPTIDDIYEFDIMVENILTPDEYQVLAVKYSGNYTITQLGADVDHHPYTAVSDFQAVVNAPTGEVYWQDKANNKVWMKIRGGVTPPDPLYAADHDFNLYELFNIKAFGTYTPLSVSPNKQDQTITFAPLPNKQTTDGSFTLSASSSSNLPISFSIVNGPATVSGNTLTLSGTAGTVTVRVSQAGNASFNAAAAVEQSFQVSAPGTTPPTKQNQTITFALLPDKQTTNGSFTLSASSSSNLPISFSIVAGQELATVSGNTLTLSGAAGTVTVRASQAGNASFNAALPVVRSFQVSTPNMPSSSKQNQSITFAAVPNKQTTDGSFTLSASSSSDLTVILSIVSGHDVATLSGNTLTLNGVTGAVTVRASQGGNANFNPAASVVRSFEVSAPSSPAKQNQIITFAQPANKQMTDAAFTLSASSNSNLPISFSIVNGPATLSGSTVTLSGTAGTVTVRASQGGNASYNAAAAVERSFQVSAPGTTPEPSLEPPLTAQLNPRNIFSPNGDGVNEIWEVVGIEQQPELRVLIFNMYGQKVYQAQPYTNSWDGAGLPEGVYYYQMQNTQGKPVKKGSLTLVR